MESLLRWSIENTTPAAPGAAPPLVRKDLDPGVIDLILGKSDAVLMKEDLEAAVDPKRAEHERIHALDHLEMLIEQIDNANNLEKLKMWEPLHGLLTDGDSTSDIVMQTLWVIGTALQNNPSAQESYLALSPLPILTSLLVSSNTTPQTRSKAIYALSGLLKHNGPAVAALGDEGWNKLRDALGDSDITVRRKAAFLINTLLTPTEHVEPSTNQPIHANSHASHLRNPEHTFTSPLTITAIHEHGILPVVIRGLTEPQPYGADGDSMGPDHDFEQKSVSLLRTYTVDCKGDFTSADKSALKTWVDQQITATPGGQDEVAEHWGISRTEMTEFVDRLK
ncbi:armadillo-type protein [Mycena floridula]|nr:armadillo-type protein [Mycena floridula]